MCSTHNNKLNRAFYYYTNENVNLDIIKTVIKTTINTFFEITKKNISQIEIIFLAFKKWTKKRRRKETTTRSEL
jgi:hypothetical protein